MTWRGLLQRRRADRERREEIEAHVQLYADDLVAAGHAPADARRRARLAFGNPTAVREALYERTGLPWLEVLSRDVRYACRLLRKSPAFTVTALLTLTLGIAVNTAVFTIVDAVLLRPLPFPDPSRLALVSRTTQADGRMDSNTSVDGRAWELVRDSVAAADDVRAAPFSSWTTGVNLVATAGGSGQPRFVQQQRIGAGFFHVLGVAPAIGREFSASEDSAGGAPAAILSWPLWTELFGRDPSIVGRTITLRGEPHIVTGIMPQGFRTGVDADVWTPLRASTEGQGSGENYQVLVRLSPGTPWAAAAGTIGAAGRRYVEERGRSAGAQVFSIVSLQEGLTADLRRPLFLLWTAVAIVLLIASVNLAGLLLARASGRSREIATRLALGSGRGAVARQLIVESLVLATIGGACGVLLGAALVGGLRPVARDVFDVWQPLAIGIRTIGIACLLALGTSVVFGMAPALQASRLDVQAGLAAGASRGVAGGASRWPRRAVIVVQVALGTVLLVAAGLLMRTYVHLARLDPGFPSANVVTASVSLEDARYRTASRVTRLFDGTLERMRAAPGIQAAAVTLGLPYERMLNLGFRFGDGREAGTGRALITNVTYVSDGYVEAMALPVHAGRSFDRRDTADASPVVLVSDAFVRTYLAGQNAIGRHVLISNRSREIVGIVGDVQVRPGWGDFGPVASLPLTYLPLTQVSDGLLNLVHGWFTPAFAVRSQLPLEQTATAMRAALDGVDPLLPFARVRAMDEVRARALAVERLLMQLLIALAAAAVGLTVIGVHGLIATSVVERTREMGIRIALGSSARGALRELATPGVALAATGVALGLVCAALGVRVLDGFVWGVGTRDPLMYAGVALLLLGVAAAASAGPASRILRLDPATTLRHE